MNAPETPRIHTLRTADGVQLAAHRLGETGAPPVVLIPGTFSNATFWIGTRGSGLARTLATEGYDVWSLDPRGHGLSQRQPPGVRWHFDHWARHDVPTVVQAAVRDDGGVILVGHSAGGSAVLAALAGDETLRDRVRAAVIIATPLPWLQHGRTSMAKLIHFATARLDTFPARLMRLGPEDEPAGVLEQWFQWNLRGHWMGDDGTDYAARLADLHLPILVLAGAGDRFWAPPRTCLGLYERIGSTKKSFVLCGVRDGFSRDYAHADIVASRAAAGEVWPLIVAWTRMVEG